ncbi:MAG: hypothetical protein U0O21_13840 [Lachnospiraceae bacterium]
MCKCPIGLNDYWGERKNTVFQIIKVNGEFVKEEVDQSRAPQVPSFMSDPERNKMRLRRLMQEEEQRAAKEEQSIVFTINMIAWSVACVMLGWIIALI